MKYFCGSERRREVLREHGTLNGIDYLEVIDHDAPDESLRQRTLILRLLKPGATLTPSQVQIFGGERIKTIGVEWVATADNLPAGLPSPEAAALIDGLEPLDEFTLVRTKAYGDYSTYTLRLVASPDDDAPPAKFDPRLNEVDFSFKVECEADVDCATPDDCITLPEPAPQLNYLAKDYGSFRQLMLDRMSLISPNWRERHAPDTGIALIELLAYAADQLSYQQDAIATEAYLGTARSRISLRRHARLVDYHVSDGCNARAWVQVKTEADFVLLPAHTQLLTRVPATPDRIPINSDIYREALRRGAEAFETVDDTMLYSEHNHIDFYTWGDEDCCLPQGATAATIAGAFPRLKAGDVLVFIEEKGPHTGAENDADPKHRWPVRLTHVQVTNDPSGGIMAGGADEALPVTEIFWDEEDALPFSVCISSQIVEGDSTEPLTKVSAVLGNIVLADHGRTIAGEDLGSVPPSRLKYAPSGSACEDDVPLPIQPRFRPTLAERPLTQAVERRLEPITRLAGPDKVVAELNLGDFATAAVTQAWLRDHDIVFNQEAVSIQGGDGFWSLSDGDQAFGLRQNGTQLELYPTSNAAIEATAGDVSRARPAIELAGLLEGTPSRWLPQRDLLGSQVGSFEFVAECENDGTVYLRFGDDRYGKRPETDMGFEATYRVGNGGAGNVGAQAIAHIVTDNANFESVTNPMPAQGGVEPESAEDIRRDAPEAFRVQERAVTEQDYEDVSLRRKDIQRAAATFRWTGSWQTVFVSADRKNATDITPAFETDLTNHLDRYRMAGYDLEIDGPQYVALQIELDICVKPDYFRAHVRDGLRRVLGRSYLADGSKAFFHPDNFSFGQSVYLSQLYAAAMAVPGVESVVVTTFQRMHSPDPKPLDEGVLQLDRLEIARLDNDPSFPDRGTLKLTLGGGK